MVFSKDIMEVEDCADDDETYDDFIDQDYEPDEEEAMEEEIIFENNLNQEMRSLNEVLNQGWTKTTTFSPHPRTFRIVPGPFTSLRATNKVSEFFGLFFDEQYIKDLIQYTNEYGDNKIDNRKRRRQQKKLWVHTEEKEFKAFIGMFILMSQVKKQNLFEYWNKSKLLGTPGIAELMTFSRFKDLYNCLALRPYDVIDE